MPNAKENMTKFPWAVNPYKLEKAIETVGDKDEKKVKAEYTKLGGLIKPQTTRQFVEPKPLYPWVSNKAKLDMAIKRANLLYNTDGKPEVTEESIKEQYILLNGLVLKTDEDTIVAPKTKKAKSADENSDN